MVVKKKSPLYLRKDSPYWWFYLAEAGKRYSSKTPDKDKAMELYHACKTVFRSQGYEGVEKLLKPDKKPKSQPAQPKPVQQNSISTNSPPIQTVSLTEAIDLTSQELIKLRRSPNYIQASKSHLCEFQTFCIKRIFYLFGHIYSVSSSSGNSQLK